jgi:hypothetical protein
MIGWETTYTSVSEGRRDKRVQCERCQAEYVYTLSRTAIAQRSRYLSIGGASAEQSASDEASRELIYGLHFGVDPRPCPRCGYFQSSMQEAAESLRLRWLDFGMYPYFLIGFILFALFCAYLNVILVDRRLVMPWYAVGLMLVPVAGLLAVIPYFRRWLLRNYNPNDLTPEQRAARGFLPGAPISKYEAVIREEQESLINLKQRAAALLDTRPPRDEADSPALKGILARYARGDMFFDGAFQASMSAELMKLKRKVDRAAEETRTYFHECIQVLTGIYIEAFGRSPIRF